MNVSLDTQLNLHDDYLVLKVKAVKPPYIKLDVFINNVTIFGAHHMQIKAGNKVKISIDPKDSYGNKARIENTVWTLSDPSLGSMEPSTDGNSVTFSSIGKVGEAVIEVAADADLTEGVRNIAGSLTLEIQPGEAVDLGLFVEPVVLNVEPAESVTEPTLDEVVVDEAPVTEPAADQVTDVLADDTTQVDPVTDQESVDPVADEIPVDPTADEVTDVLADDTTPVDPSTTEPVEDTSTVTPSDAVATETGTTEAEEVAVVNPTATDSTEEQPIV